MYICMCGHIKSTLFLEMANYVSLHPRTPLSLSLSPIQWPFLLERGKIELL